MKAKILAKLKNSNTYISGQELSKEFNVSRTAIWKIISRLREEGYEIEAVKNKGYRIVSVPDILSKSELESVVKSEYTICYEDEVDSTNNYAKRIAEQGAKNKTLVVSDCQFAGKGRKGKSFSSVKQQGIFMTLLIRPDIKPQNASMLTIIAAVAVQNGIYKATGLECKIKWPNDIICNGKKICGILTEMSTEMQSINYIVIGIGINTGNDSFPDDIKDVATSIKIETGGKSYKRSSIIAEVINSFDEYYEKFVSCQNLSCIKEYYDKYLVNAGEKVKIVGEKESYEAVAIGIDDDGELLVNRNGKIVKIVSGEVSVRGVYGYV